MDAAAYRRHCGPDCSWLTFPALEKFPWLGHGFSLRIHDFGVNTLVPADLEKLAPTGGFRPGHLDVCRQLHGDIIHIVDRPVPPFSLQGDALATDTPGLGIGVQVADCVPVLLVEEGRRTVAAVHAGWRGQAAGIIGKSVRLISGRFKGRPEHLTALVGPSIGPCCYEVGPEVAAHFPDVCVIPKTGNPHLDLWRSTEDQLAAAGLSPENIHNVRLCTRCRQDLFYSYRGGDAKGRMLAFVGIKGGD